MAPKLTIEKAEVLSKKEIAEGIYLIETYSPEIARSCNPGQFCNIKVSDAEYPLLRRPFSICESDDGNISYMFNIQGSGTKILASKEPGDIIDVLGPLGNGFKLDDLFTTAALIAGGIGAAPFPFLIKKIKSVKKIISFAGAKSKNGLIKYQFPNLYAATDDGSEGFNGNVVNLFRSKLSGLSYDALKVFACGPTPMLRALQQFCLNENIECELSTESAMACGFGICMGCSIEPANGDEYKLICKHGPVFGAREIKL